MPNSAFAIRTVVALLVLTVASANVCAQSDNGRGRHKQLYAPPVPDKITIDGKLDDWDLSGQIEMFVVQATRETMNAKFAMQYGQDGLYVSGVVADPSPLMNRNDPAANPGKGWNADSCQFRMTIDPEAEYPIQESVFTYRGKGKEDVVDTRDDILHMTLWYYTDGKLPCLAIQKGMTYRPLREGWLQGLVPNDQYKAAYARHEDGRGYTFEYFLPWKLLGPKRPLTGGDAVAGTVQFNWSTPEGFSTAGGAAWSYDVMSRSGFAFQETTCWGRIFFHKTNGVPKELVLEGVPQDRPLPLAFDYALPADGEATIQLFRKDGTAMRILVPQQQRLKGTNTERWDGLTDWGEILPAGEYVWKGVQFKEPLRAEYLFSAHNSGKPPYQTDNGRGAWGGDHGTPQDVASAGDKLLMIWDGAEFCPGTILTDSEGRKLWGTDKTGHHLAVGRKHFFSAGQYNLHDGQAIAIFDLSSGRPAALKGGVEAIMPPTGGDKDTNHISGLACDGTTLYASFRDRNLVALYSTEDGSLKATWSVPAPGRLAIRPDGSLAAVSGSKVVTIAEGKIADWLTDHLDEPQGVAVAKDGTAYVANRGDLQNVSVFSAGGAYQRSIGKAGGRPARGKYEPSGMLAAGGVALDAKGQLWVAETMDAPKRISRWDVNTTQLIAEFFGGSGYMAPGDIDPARPNEILGEDVVWNIDWQNQKTTPAFTAWRPMAPDDAPAVDYAPFRLLTATDGNQYLWGYHRNSRTVHNVVARRDGDLFKPFLAIFNTAGDDDTGIALLEKDKETYPRQAPKRPAHAHPAYLWQDGNDNQKIEAEEITALPVGLEFPEYARVGLSWMEDDLTLRLTGGYLWKPVGKNAQGAPVYNPLKTEKAAAWGNTRITTGLNDGTLITLDWVSRFRKGNHGLVRWNTDGEMLWNYPNLVGWHHALNLPTVGPGRLWGMTGTMGLAGEFFGHQTYFGPVQLFRIDGMYLGAILKDGRNSLTRDAYEGMPEGQFGTIRKLTIDGQERYVSIGAGGDVRVWEIHGLAGITDLPGGVYVHTDEMAAKATRAKREYEASIHAAKKIQIVAGGLAALAAAPAVRRELENGRSFEARLSYDAANLYVRYDVVAPFGLENAIADKKIIFRGGNLLDLQLAADPQADANRSKPAPGDLRLLVTRKENKPFAVLFQPKLAGFKGEPIVLTSPTGTESFDRITELEEVTLDYEKTATGFVTTLTIPQQALGLKLAKGQPLKMDLGYIFGNQGGTRTATRAYLFNDSFTANVVDDIPHESRLEPANWGQAEVH